MADYCWGEITIGGNVSLEIWNDLKLAIYNDTGTEYEKPPTKKGYIILEESELPYGMFSETEDACAKHGIPYHRRSQGPDPELMVYTPTNIEEPSHSYSLNVEFDLMTHAEELMEFRNALKEITLVNAPTFINDKRIGYQKYSKYLLSGGDLLDFIKNVLDDYLPPSIPDLPKFKVLK